MVAHRARRPSPLRSNPGPPAGGRLPAQFLPQTPFGGAPSAHGWRPRPQGHPPRGAGWWPPYPRAPTPRPWVLTHFRGGTRPAALGRRRLTNRHPTTPRSGYGAVLLFRGSRRKPVTVRKGMCHICVHGSFLHDRAAAHPGQAGHGRRPGAVGPGPAHPGTRRRAAHPAAAERRGRGDRGPAAAGRRGPAGPYGLRREAQGHPARPQAARRGRQAVEGRERQPGIRRARRHLRDIPEGVRPALRRRQGAAADGQRPLPPGLQQRVLERRADGLRGRRRHDLPRLHPPGRRHRPRTDPRRHAVHREPRLPRPVRRAQRVGVRRVRQPHQAVRARAERRPGGLADRRGAARAGRARHGAALHEGAGHRLRRPAAGQGPAARHHGRLRLRRAPTTAGCTSTPASPTTRSTSSPRRSAGNAWEQAGQIWYDTLTGGSLAADADFAAFAGLTLASAKARYGDGAQVRAVQAAWTGVGVTPAAAPAAATGLPRQQPGEQTQEA